MINKDNNKYGDMLVVEEHDRFLVAIHHSHKEALKQFAQKTDIGFYAEFAKNNSIDAPKSHTILSIDKKHLTTKENLADFNRRVQLASEISADHKFEFDAVHSVIDLSVNEGKKKVVLYGQDKDKTSGKAKNVAYATVLVRTDKYVGFDCGQNEQAHFFRVLPTENFLLTEEDKLKRRDVLGDRLALSEFKKLTWTNKEGETPRIETKTEIPYAQQKAECESKANNDLAQEQIESEKVKKNMHAEQIKRASKRNKPALRA